jgi:hypothetical protein
VPNLSVTIRDFFFPIAYLGGLLLVEAVQHGAQPLRERGRRGVQRAPQQPLHAPARGADGDYTG